jgi:hypothetical protein
MYVAVRAVLPDAKPENPEFQSQNPEKSGKIRKDFRKSVLIA